MKKSPFTIKKKVTEEDLMQMREWKNILVKRRDAANVGSEMHILFSDELIRVVDLLTTLTIDKID